MVGYWGTEDGRPKLQGVVGSSLFFDATVSIGSKVWSSMPSHAIPRIAAPGGGVFAGTVAERQGTERSRRGNQDNSG